jgi:Protein of unknown function (DUF2934)
MGDSQSEVPETSVQKDVANVAYTVLQKRGCPNGSSEVDWLGAERQVSQASEIISH